MYLSLDFHSSFQTVFHGGDSEVLQRIKYFPIGKKPTGLSIYILLFAMRFYLKKEFIAIQFENHIIENSQRQDEFSRSKEMTV